MQIAVNTVASIEYTLKDDEGRVLDSSEGRGPLTYLHGVGNLIPGLESALEGQAAGADLEVTVAPSDAYGERDERLVQAVPRAAFAGVDQVEPGMQFQAADPNGGGRLITVTAVEGEEVTVDANHPLAGKLLSFRVSIVDVREATAEEIEAGEVATTD
jgi:FKBP-type peptidyl-prolyl cis-trans isomerase SlyD